MGRGKYQNEYFFNPKINKPIEAIYEDLDGYSYEVFPDEPDRFFMLEIAVVLPPVEYEGKFLKGILFTIGGDALLELCPEFASLFHIIAYSGWTSYAWSKKADAYLSIYDNPEREAWFKRTQPDRADKILIPYESPEYTLEYMHPPERGLERDVDVLMVSRLDDLKNVPFLARALKVYRQKYAHRIRMTLVQGNHYDVHLEGLSPHQAGQFREIESILVHPNDYIQFVPIAPYYTEMFRYYSRARMYVLGSLFEGRNRSLHEAMVFGAPVICCKQFNQYARGQDEAFPDGAGLYTDYDPEAMADTIHFMWHHYPEFTPRKAFLEKFGRKNFANTCIDKFPYYARNLPGYQAGHHHENVWLDLAVQKHYQISYADMIFARRHDLTNLRGLDKIKGILGFYLAKFSRFVG